LTVDNIDITRQN